MCYSAPAFAQTTASSSTLRVTVQDETAAALLHASATLVDANGIEQRSLVDDRGVATFVRLVPGTYRLTVEADAFRPSTTDVSIKRGDNQTRVRLSVAMQEEIIVNEQGANERRDNGFTTTLTQEEIDALSDDPEEMEEQYHDAGMVRVEVITKPGFGGWRGQFNAGFRDESLNARNPFATAQGPEQQRRFLFSFQGPLAKDATSMSVSADGNNSYDPRTVVAFTPTGTVNEQVRRPVDSLNATVRIEHALSTTSTLRAEYQRRSDERRNLGVGDFELFERAYDTESSTDTFRVRNTRLLGKKAFSELRVELSQTETSDRSASAEPAIRVLDAFTSGGAGRLGARKGRQFEVAQNVDFTVRKHAFRAGVLFEAGWWNSTQQTNANGTFTFSSLDDYLAGVAATYTRRAGDPLVSYSQYQAGWYVQDDFRLRKNLSVSLGVRQEVQTHVDDSWNVAPRAALTWTLGKTNVRAGWGVFYDWLESNTYEQTIRLDGTRQIEEVVVNPTFPDASRSADTRLPASVIRRAGALTQPTIQQASIGFDRNVTEWMGLRSDYMWTRGSHTLRSVNVNAPAATGARPDASLGNISEIQSSGKTAQDRFTLGMNLRVPSRRLFGNVMYQWANTRNYADSPLSLPASSLNPNADWGPAAQDIRHRIFLMANVPILLGVRAGFNVQGSSAPPYTITTGRDDNGDTVFNDRPEGVGRNSARGAAQWNVTLRLSRSFNLGGTAPGGDGSMPGGPASGGAPRGPGGGAGEGVGGPQMMVMQGSTARYRLDLHLQAFNLLNHTNLNAFVGNVLSPAFGRATSAAMARRFEIGATLAF
ncbi:MAG: TonB-dependent receptor [Acidobacteria bacterium]|nr:TonB-dependent receptor [Acidobacteriota bacterium]